MMRRYDDFDDYIIDLERRCGIDIDTETSPMFSPYGDNIFNCGNVYEKGLCPSCRKHRVSVVGIDPDWAPDWHGHVVRLECIGCGWTKTGEVSI